jgi:hypothetical protein
MNLEDLRYCRDDLIMPVWAASIPGHPLTSEQVRRVHRAVTAVLEGDTWSAQERDLLQETRDLSNGVPSGPVLTRERLPLVLNVLKRKIEELERQPRQPASAWDALGELVANAEHSSDLKPLLDLGGLLRPVDREGLAQVVGSLIRAAEWPARWVKPRGELVRALEDLAPLIDTTKSESAMSQLGVNPRTPLAMGSVLLRVVVHLLATPCPPGELRYVAAIGNMVVVLVSDTIREELAAHGLVVPPSIAAVREQLGAGLFRYGEAARRMNDACGEVLFNPLRSEP